MTEQAIWYFGFTACTDQEIGPCGLDPPPPRPGKSQSFRVP